MTEYVVGFEEDFANAVLQRVPPAMNMYEAEELQAEATAATVELLTTLDYVAQVDSKGIIKVDKPIDSQGLEAIKKMFGEFRITTWDGQDKGDTPLLIKERSLEEITEPSNILPT